MKRILTIFFSVLYTNFVFSQSIVFNNMYNYSLDTILATNGYYTGSLVGSDNAITHVLELEDSTFLTSGFGNNRWDYSNDLVHYYFQGFKLDKYGNVTDIVNIDPVYSGLEIPNTIAKDDSFVYIGGYKNDSLNDILDKNLLIKLKKDFSSYNIIDVVYGDTVNSINASDVIDSFLYISNSYYNNGQYDFNLTKLDNVGNIIDTLIFSSPQSSFSVINKNFKDSLLLIMEQVNDNFNYSYFIFHKINLSTYMITESDTLFFEQGKLNVARQLYILENNEIVICGWYKDIFGSNRTKSALLKIDFAGNTIWIKKYDLDLNSTNDDGIAAIQQSGVSSFVMAGYTENNSSYIKGKMLKIEANTGDIIWERTLQRDTFTYVNSGFDDILYEMIMTKDNGFLINGRGRRIELIGNTNLVKRADDAWLLKTDSCGFTTNNFPEPSFVVDSMINQTVYISNTSDNYCTAVLHFGNGDSTTFYAYENPRPNLFTYTYADTGTYTISLTALAGEEFVTYTNSITILEDTTVAIKEIEIENFEVSLFPNPAKESLNIVFGEEMTQKNSLIKAKVFDYSSKQISSKILKTNIQKNRLDISSLSNGIYFIRFYNTENNFLGTKRFAVLK